MTDAAEAGNPAPRMTIEEYYSPSVCERIAEAAQGKEIAIEYEKGRFGHRPMVINYQGDVSSLVNQGASAFHCSVETWRNPLELKTEATKEFLDALRTGWDYLIDIDSKAGWECAREATLVFTGALEHYGITDYGIKFSGRRGFHLVVPFEAFPRKIDNTMTEAVYPDLLKKITEHLKSFCRDELAEQLQRAGLSKEGQSPYDLAEIDSAIFTSRHMFRMPYSLHLGTYLASIPLERKDIERFKIEDAKPENANAKTRFLSRECTSDASELVRTALFQHGMGAKEEPEARGPRRALAPIEKAQPENFPPCIKSMLEGLADGRKRADFLLSLYFLNTGWRKEDIEAQLIEWNKKNRPPLRNLDLLAPLKGQARLVRVKLPPNCDNQAYYAAISVCKPDALCSRIKNPLSYTIAKAGRKKTRRRKSKNDNIRDPEKHTEAGKEDKQPLNPQQ